MTTNNELVEALRPVLTRVRRDASAIRTPSGDQAWTREHITPERMLAHVDGTKPRGVCPIRAGESVCSLALFDMDSHKGEVSWQDMSVIAGGLCDALQMRGLRPIPWRSGGGNGMHIYLLWAEPQDAASVRALMCDALAAVGLRNGAKGVQAGQVEVFPKQDSVPVDGFGNQFILPLTRNSVPLDATWGFEPMPRESVIGMQWPLSEPVPLIDRALVSTAAQAAPDRERIPLETLRAALAAIPNEGEQAPDYDDWRNIVFALHAETGGSDEGLALAREFSARNPVHDDRFLTQRVWPYIKLNGEGGGALVTGSYVLMRAQRAGWTPPAADLFDDLTVTDPAPRGENALSVPEALHLTTDSANVQRLLQHFGTKLLVVNDHWHAWDGRRWAKDEAMPTRYAMSLSHIVAAEAQMWDDKVDETTKSAIQAAARKKADKKAAAKTRGAKGAKGDSGSAGGAPWDEGGGGVMAADGVVEATPIDELEQLFGETEDDEEKAFEFAERCLAVAEALRKWAVRCEMRSTIDAALSLAKRVLTVDTSKLDTNPWLVNCLNGTFDVRENRLLPHNPDDLITKLAPVNYVHGGSSQTFARVLRQVTCEYGGPDPVARFLMRWFGYCATGSVREQVLVVHYGSGSNGKSTILDTIADVMGDYAGTAAPGLLMSSGNERHPTEIADLLGTRMVTAHESGDGGVLREDFVKQATGGDKLKGRYMRGDFFEFSPVHKLQLLTNHKPVIKGSDHGVWRRVKLVPYRATFGTAAEIQSGKAQYPKDETLIETLRKERDQVFSMVLAASVEWLREGLNPPDYVQVASSEYRREQDRVGQFLAECCEVGRDKSVDLTDPNNPRFGGLYGAYQQWCDESGSRPLSKMKLLPELERLIPAFSTKSAKRAAFGRRVDVKVLIGVGLMGVEVNPLD